MDRVRRLASWERHTARQQERRRTGYSLEVEVLADGEEDGAVERRGPGEGGHGGEGQELQRLEGVGDLRHAAARVGAAAAQVRPPLRVGPQRVVERERQQHARGRRRGRHGDHLAGAQRATGGRGLRRGGLSRQGARRFCPKGGGCVLQCRVFFYLQYGSTRGEAI
jgi:hypothetical protein